MGKLIPDYDETHANLSINEQLFNNYRQFIHENVTTSLRNEFENNEIDYLYENFIKNSGTYEKMDAPTA